MSTNWRPTRNRFVIARLPLPEQTQSGLFLLGREYPALGRVIAFSHIRSDWLDLCADLQLGDLVYFNRAATELRAIPGEPDHFILDLDDLWVRIREP